MGGASQLPTREAVGNGGSNEAPGGPHSIHRETHAETSAATAGERTCSATWCIFPEEVMHVSLIKNNNKNNK